MAFTPVSLPRLESTVCQPHTTTYLTEQQMQPFPTSSHSSTLSSPWLTVRDFSMSSAAEVLEFIYVGWITASFAHNLQILRGKKRGLAQFR